MKHFLKLLEKDAHLTPAELALMCETEEGDIKALIEGYEKDGVILGYTTVIDWDKTDIEYVNALIELKVTPRVGSGYDEIAERIYSYPEVESVYLMSGAYDLYVVVKGRTFHEVSNFVSRELALIDSVISTGTQFVMRRYKEYHTELIGDDTDGRSNVSL